jgi:hypothetical protein
MSRVWGIMRDRVRFCQYGIVVAYDLQIEVGTYGTEPIQFYFHPCQYRRRYQVKAGICDQRIFSDIAFNIVSIDSAHQVYDQRVVRLYSVDHILVGLVLLKTILFIAGKEYQEDKGAKNIFSHWIKKEYRFRIKLRKIGQQQFHN